MAYYIFLNFYRAKPNVLEILLYKLSYFKSFRKGEKEKVGGEDGKIFGLNIDLNTYHVSDVHTF